MTILTALASLYDRLADAGEAPRPRYSVEKIGAEVVLDEEGNVIRIAPKLVTEGTRRIAASLSVPAAVKRTAGIKPNRLWDKTAYVLGITAKKDEGGKPITDDEGRMVPGQEKRTAAEHEAFKLLHQDLLADATDPGLIAMRRFLETWHPSDFAARGFPEEALDQNIVFRLDGDTDASGVPLYVHERPAAVELISAEEPCGNQSLCLVTGERASIARLHPSIKGVLGAQSSGASIVSFNLNAFESYGKTQGENAPVSERAAYAYTTALNALLARDSGRNVRIGDATVVFWAETQNPKAAATIEDLLFGALQPEDDDAANLKIRAALEAVAKGQATDGPELDPQTRVYILGLAPNASRLSIRFWNPGTFGDFARQIMRFWQDLELDPAPWKGPPAAWSLLYETAIQRKAENISPLLGGELMRAVLTGAPYPRPLLSSVVGRIRADGEINGRRAAICRAFVNRNIGQEVIPVGLDPDNPNPAYRLGRLFAVLESIQRRALPGLNATIKDRYFAAASSTPARVFPVLVKNATHHLAVMRKGDGGGLAHWLDSQMGEIWAGLEADLPRSLNLEDQGRFVAGYYHQRWARKKADETEGAEELIDAGSEE
ncbi:type I-C CRISPR-associated protein Cas8c/Csd1 [Limibaculum sp. M0105]|uniref:Type I-C CRISPR-associated protein Cas8c/Csd1 n=1 Tax=Thermohalobaculum xanthum TaxID=2753746 RepID=A0A8J7SC17_9RHOB|nr:type I-C CRISPR-associated protein Cas8c/Csd1 [Thermohalobaculum xanthum]MBK0398488.1 type I-C CRISPR-associated protein Cas8c/Csd1 [Thermohalobaculum xanthum]